MEEKKDMVRILILITSYLLAICLASCSGGGGGGGSGTTPAPQHSISGAVTSGGSALDGITMALTGTGSASSNTDRNGTYQFPGLSAGSYVITPSKSGYTFSPASRTVPLGNGDITGQDFTATPVTQYSISGRVTSGGSALDGTTMALTGAGSASTNTDSNGAYQFTDLNSGSYTITPSRAGFAFNPPNSPVTVNNTNITGQDFAATLVTWARAYGQIDNDRAHAIVQTSDGGFIFAGETFNFGAVYGDVWVLKLRDNGDI